MLTTVSKISNAEYYGFKRDVELYGVRIVRRGKDILSLKA